MKDNKKNFFAAIQAQLITWAKGLLQLWSLETLTNLPDRLNAIWQKLLGSYWFIPIASIVAGILLAPILLAVDERFDREMVRDISFAFTGDADAARAIMTAIAGAVLGVAGTTFSITIAVLSMASSQFGPRLLRNFLTDTSNQFVLGIFLGTFSYSLLVLKSIHKFDVDFGVPQLAVTFAVFWAIICALLLVYFVQHMVHAIQASHVIQGASNEAIKNIRYWYSDHCELQHQRDLTAQSLDKLKDYHEWPKTTIYAPRAGYLQQIYLETLILLARDYGGVIQLHTNLGNFVTDHNVIGHFYQRPATQIGHVQKTKTSHLAIMPRAPDGLFWQRFANGVDIEARPSHSNDITYSLGQMTEIAVRALSPGINDPKTAVNCVQSLTTCISIMMRLQPPSPYHFYSPEHDGDLSDITVNQPAVALLALITKTPVISDFIDASLGEIRRYASADLPVLKALCTAITDLNYARVNSAQRQTLLHELTLIERAGRSNLAYHELMIDLQAMCAQARQFIHDDDAKQKHFEYISAFDKHIRKSLIIQ